MHESIWVALALGYCVSAVAERLLPPGQELGNKLFEHAVAMLGAYLATVGGHLLSIYKSGEEASFMGAVVGAAVLLGLYRLGWEVYVRVTARPPKATSAKATSDPSPDRGVDPGSDRTIVKPVRKGQSSE